MAGMGIISDVEINPEITMNNSKLVIKQNMVIEVTLA